MNTNTIIRTSENLDDHIGKIFNEEGFKLYDGVSKQKREVKILVLKEASYEEYVEKCKEDGVRKEQIGDSFCNFYWVQILD